jgi:hypothetical protein
MSGTPRGKEMTVTGAMREQFNRNYRVRKRIFLTWLAALLSAANARAIDNVHPQTGTSAFPFLGLTYDARAAAMAGAAVAMPNDLRGVLANPAALGFASQRQVLLGFRPIFIHLHVTGTPSAIAVPLPQSYGIIAASMVYVSYGSIDETNELGALTGTIWKSYSLLGAASWAKLLWPSLAVGATVKGLYDKQYSHMEQSSADGIAADIGAQYRLFDSRLILGMAIQNAGMLHDDFGNATPNHRLPITGVAGISYIPQSSPQLRIALDMAKATDDFLVYRPGAEIDAYNRQFFIRAGYSFSHRDLREKLSLLWGESDEGYEKTNWSSICIGVGLNLEPSGVAINVDAAYEARAGGLDPAFVLSTLLYF